MVAPQRLLTGYAAQEWKALLELSSHLVGWGGWGLEWERGWGWVGVQCEELGLRVGLGVRVWVGFRVGQDTSGLSQSMTQRSRSTMAQSTCTS